MVEEKSWVVEVKEKLQQVRPGEEEEENLWKKHSIYRVPTLLKDLNSKAYAPQVVSFGPYHHGEEGLNPMEEHKQRALLHFLKRSGKGFEECWRALEEVVEGLMDCYEGLSEEWRERKRFLQLMILDGCFILEILFTSAEISNDYAFNDPIFSSHGKLYNMPYIRRDMMMVENQIPLLVLEKLISIQFQEVKEEYFLNKLILKFCTNSTHVPKVGPGLYVLDIYRKSMLHGPLQLSRSTPQTMGGGNGIVRSAMELHEAGILFRKSDTQSLMDITFHGGILRLPVVVVDDTTESMFRNMMAFERLHVGAGNEVTAYVFFMDNIIDSAKDVSLLHGRGIIQNAMGSDKAVAKLFNLLSKDVTLDPETGLGDVQERVNGYCKKSWNEWRANLIHTYFRSPWAFLSLFAAIFLLMLTVAQTIYTIYPYYKNSATSPPTDSTPSPSPH